LQNGKVDKYLFNGGYCQNEDDNLAFYYFNQDKMIIDEYIKCTAAQDDRCKYAVEFQTVDPQDQERFDKKVIATGNSYSPLPSTKYRLAPSESDGTVNCNKGSYNLLKRSGVSEQLLKAVGERIPGKI
jgi:hypothetical protein